jgi:hypothetical protein
VVEWWNDEVKQEWNIGMMRTSMIADERTFENDARPGFIWRSLFSRELLRTGISALRQSIGWVVVFAIEAAFQYPITPVF